MANNSIIGVFTAKDNNYGYVIPIQTILEKFEDEKKLAKPSSSMVDVSLIWRRSIKVMIKEISMRD
jgi:hypothetical protein